MAADVLPQDEEGTALPVEDGGSMEAPGSVEDGLLGAEPAGEGAEDCRVDHQGVVPDRERGPGRDGVERVLPADPARARRRECPDQAGVGNPDMGGQDDVESAGPTYPSPGVPDAGTHRRHVLSPPDDAFAHEETGGQVEVGTRRAHGHGERCSRQPQLQGLLDRHGVGPPAA